MAWDNKPQCSWSSLHILKFGTTKFHHQSNTCMRTSLPLWLALSTHCHRPYKLVEYSNQMIHTLQIYTRSYTYVYEFAIYKVHASNKSSYKWCYRYSFITYGLEHWDYFIHYKLIMIECLQAIWRVAWYCMYCVCAFSNVCMLYIVLCTRCINA